MSRSDTIQQSKWRVSVVKTDGTVSHESLFADLTSADAYYQSIEIEGSTKKLAVREAGKHRFEVLKSLYMTSFPCCGGNDESVPDHCMDCPRKCAGCGVPRFLHDQFAPYECVETECEGFREPTR